MEWKLISIDQETEHRFLNFFTLHYEVTDNGVTKPYSYFLCSRRNKEDLRAKVHDYHRPDGVILALYKTDEKTGEISVLLTKQFRPAIGAYVNSFVAGLLDEGDESEIVAAKREAEEEAGLFIDDVEILSPASPTSTGLSDEMCAFCVGRVIGVSHQHLEDFEDISSRFVSLKELKRMLNDPNEFFPLNIRLVSLILLQRFGA